MKKIFRIIILIAAVGAFLHYRQPIENYFRESSKIVLSNFASSTLASQIQKIEEQISAPPPLKGSQDSSNNTNLTLAGVIKWTNENRSQYGKLPPLTENVLLNAAAEAKLQDMFKQQYFEHINPQGRGPADLAKTAGYDYISIGENLALGNFGDDQKLVEAWMNSPGHRANILNNKYQEIGVAVGRGMYEGRQTWLAVQEFGKPASSCPSISSNLKAEIASLQDETNQLIPQLTKLKNEIDSSHPKTQEEYDAHNQKVSEYNALVKIYNNKVDRLKAATDQYNNQVRAYNACSGA